MTGPHVQMLTVDPEDEVFGNLPCVVLPCAGPAPADALRALLAVTEDLATFIAEHPEIDEDEPWFAWAFEHPNGVQFEKEVFAAAATAPELRPLVDQYVQRVIAYFRATEAEPGFYTHEELEAGSIAVESLVANEPNTYFERYLEFLRAIDLEHTCEQHSVVRRIAPKLSEKQSEQLRATLGELSGGEYFPEL